MSIGIDAYCRHVSREKSQSKPDVIEARIPSRRHPLTSYIRGWLNEHKHAARATTAKGETP